MILYWNVDIICYHTGVLKKLDSYKMIWNIGAEGRSVLYISPSKVSVRLPVLFMVVSLLPSPMPGSGTWKILAVGK